jgi:hypothetical protein
MWIAVLSGALAASSPIASPGAHHLTPRFVVIESGGGLGVDVENTTVFSADGEEPGLWFISRNSNESNWCGHAANDQCRPTKTSGDDWIEERRCPALHDIMNQLMTIRAAERFIAFAVIRHAALVTRRAQRAWNGNGTAR